MKRNKTFKKFFKNSYSGSHFNSVRCSFAFLIITTNTRTLNALKMLMDKSTSKTNILIQLLIKVKHVSTSEVNIRNYPPQFKTYLTHTLNKLDVLYTINPISEKKNVLMRSSE